MEVITTQKYIGMGPRKLRLIADMVRKLQPAKALDILAFTQKAAAKEMSGAIKVALANAKQMGLTSEIQFKSIEVNEGPKLKRIHAGTRGRAKPYQKKMCHIKIVLSDEIKVENKGKALSGKGKEKGEVKPKATSKK